MSKYILVFVFFSSIKYSYSTNSFADIICEKTSWYSHEIEMFALDKSEASKALKISSEPSVFIGYSRGSSNKDVINNNQKFTCYKMDTNINNLNVCCVTNNLDINIYNGEIKADQSRNKKETKPHSKVIFKLVNYKHILSKNKLEDNLVIKQYYVNYKRRLKRNAQENDSHIYHVYTTQYTTVEPIYLNDLSATENTITYFDITTDVSVIKETYPTEDNDSTIASDTKDSTSYSELDPSTNLYSSESTTDPSIATDMDTTTQLFEYTDIDSTTYSPTDADPSTSSETDSPAYSQSTYDSTDGDLTQEPSSVNPTTVIYDDDDDDDYDDGDGDYKGRVSWSPWTIGLVVFASTVVVSILAVSAYHLGKISERSKEFFSEDLEPPNIVVIPRARLNRY